MIDGSAVECTRLIELTGGELVISGVLAHFSRYIILNGMTSYVYEITSLDDDKVYTGKADDVEIRWLQHLQYAQNPLYKAMAQRGVENFKLTIVSEHPTKLDALKEEEARIDKYIVEGRSLNRSDKGRRKKPKRVYSFGKLVTWNGVLNWNDNVRQFYGEFRVEGKRERVRRHVPIDLSNDKEAALKWFANYVQQLNADIPPMVGRVLTVDSPLSVKPSPKGQT